MRLRYSAGAGGGGALRPDAGRRRRGRDARRRVRAHAELYMGLVEVGRGPHPRRRRLQGAAVARARRRCPTTLDPFPFVKQVFQNIGSPRSRPAPRRRGRSGFLRERDGVTLQPRAPALRREAARARAWRAPATGRRGAARFRLPGESGFATIAMMLQMMPAAHQICAARPDGRREAGARAHRRRHRADACASPRSSCSTSSARRSSRSAARRRPASACMYMLRTTSRCGISLGSPGPPVRGVRPRSLGRGPCPLPRSLWACATICLAHMSLTVPAGAFLFTWARVGAQVEPRRGVRRRARAGAAGAAADSCSRSPRPARPPWP